MKLDGVKLTDCVQCKVALLHIRDELGLDERIVIERVCGDWHIRIDRDIK